ncbi:aldose 1-epimerase [Hydrogenophaga sp. RWCD_12]|uniref:aldose 1-epimerase n=1 Tax=Hydrogenophaga sp. RWCD_12 TaxID=3391190 RepID=UPI003984EE6F
MSTSRSVLLTSLCGGHTVHWLDDGRQRLGLVPGMGGSVATWMLHPSPTASGHPGHTPFHLWRPWFGDPDPFSVASLPLVPWSNRVSGGGFELGGQFHPLQPNRAGEPYPIHGEGWLQPWEVVQHDDRQLVMRLTSARFMDSPYHYCATQSYRLLPDGIEQTLSVTHLGEQPLPYGLGQHPWLLRTPDTRLRATVTGVWLSHPDRLPREHSSVLGTWDLQHGISAHGALIDNAFTGWQGAARIEWPEAGWALTVREPATTRDGVLLVFRPEAGPTFCVEPVSHPIDAFHLPGQPGLCWLGRGESTEQRLLWQFERLSRPPVSASSLRA